MEPFASSHICPRSEQRELLKLPPLILRAPCLCHSAGLSVPGAINPGMKDLLRLTLVSDVLRDKLISGLGRVGGNRMGAGEPPPWAHHLCRSGGREVELWKASQGRWILDEGWGGWASNCVSSGDVLRRGISSAAAAVLIRAAASSAPYRHSVFLSALWSPSSRSRHAVQESGKARGCCAGESPAGPRSAPLCGSRGPLRLGAGVEEGPTVVRSRVCGSD